MQVKPIIIGKIYKNCDDRIENYCKNNTKAVSNFISNLNTNELQSKNNELTAISTYFYNTYLADKNPYKIAKFRKDWKFAAETFIKETIGKYYYVVSERHKKYYDNMGYNSIEQLVKDGYNFKLEDIDQYLESEIIKYDKKISSCENEIRHLNLDLKDIRQNWVAPTLQHQKTDAELLDLYNNSTLISTMWGTPDSYIKYVRSEELKNDNKAKFGYEYTQEYKDKINKIKDLENNIKLYKKFVEEFKSPEYKTDVIKHYKNVHKEFDKYNIEKYGLMFSKREITLFIDSLNLKTKICPCKFRKIIIDEFLKNKLLNSYNNGKYDRFKCIAKRYFFNKDNWISMVKYSVNKFKEILTFSKNFIYFYKKYNIKLENHILKKLEDSQKILLFSINNIKLLKQFAPRVEYFSPPD